MNKLIISLAIIILLVSILCLKISIFEYFSIEDNLQKIIKNFENDFDVKLNLKKVKQECPKEYEACLNDKALEKILDNLVKNPTSTASLSILSKMPKSFENMQTCIINNGLIDI